MSVASYINEMIPVALTSMNHENHLKVGEVENGQNIFISTWGLG